MPALEQNLSRFFHRSADGRPRTVILPIDHGTGFPVPGLARPGDLVGALSRHCDGFVMNYGAIRAARPPADGKGVCLRTDVYKPAHGTNPDHGSYRVFGAAEALRSGAHAVMNMLYLHHPEENRIFTEAATLISECHADGLPVILESLPFGVGRPADYTPANISLAVRAAAEIGADVVKTAYPGDRDAFAAIVAASFVPVIVLGGSPAPDERAFLHDVRDAIAAGAAGVAIGRNVWAHPQPQRMARALQRIVHENATVEAAWAP
jgi:DhnA family fructose-bisphosphate aldolase class Ia